jgi:hypothetical protein
MGFTSFDCRKGHQSKQRWKSKRKHELDAFRPRPKLRITMMEKMMVMRRRTIAIAATAIVSL